MESKLEHGGVRHCRAVGRTVLLCARERAWGLGPMQQQREKQEAATVFQRCCEPRTERICCQLVWESSGAEGLKVGRRAMGKVVDTGDCAVTY